MTIQPKFQSRFRGRATDYAPRPCSWAAVKPRQSAGWQKTFGDDGCSPCGLILVAFSSEVDTGSREENASKQKIRALVLFQSEPKSL
jgi:hypothetical protein